MADGKEEEQEKVHALTVSCQRGTKNALLDMAVANAQSLWESGKKKEEQKTAAHENSSGEIIADKIAAEN